MEGADVSAERLEVECRGRIRPLEPRAGVGEREGSLSRRERVAVQQRERLAGLELEVAERPVREVGVLCEVRLADRPE